MEADMEPNMIWRLSSLINRLLAWLFRLDNG